MRILKIAAISAALFAIVMGGIFFASGGRTFIIQTPSMGTYAPVGSFVMSKPVNINTVEVGDMVLFNPPATEDTFFHRVTDVTPEGLKTKGDINGTTDPWVINQENLTGKEYVHIPNLGFLFNVLPFLIIGGIAIQFITKTWVGAYYRFPTRIASWALLFSAATFWSRPFFNANLVSQAVENGTATTTFVPTGIFGMTGTAVKGSSGSGQPGELITVVSDWHDKADLYNVNIVPYLTTANWVVIVLTCLTPLILCSIYAVHARITGKDLIEEQSEEPTP